MPPAGAIELEAHRDVDGIAHQVVAAFDDIAEVGADAQAEAVFGGSQRVGRAHRLLDLDRRPDSLYRTREFGEQAVAGHLEDAAAVLLDVGLGEGQAGSQAGGAHAPRCVPSAC